MEEKLKKLERDHRTTVFISFFTFGWVVVPDLMKMVLVLTGWL